MFTINRKWLDRCSTLTERGMGYTTAQFAVLGLPYNPPPGWKGRLVGKVITEQQCSKFAQLANDNQIRYWKYKTK